MAWFDDDEFDPQTYAGQGGGGLLGRLLAVNPGLASSGAAGGDTEAPPALPQLPGANQTDPVTTDENGRPLRRVYITSPLATPDQSTSAPDGSESSGISSLVDSPDDARSDDGQGGLLGRLLALQTEQSRRQPIPDGSTYPPLPQTGNSRPSSAPCATTSPSSVGGIELDPVDIGKSLAVGAANGVVSTLGLPADALAAIGYPSDWTASHGSDGWRRSTEATFNTKFYQPRSMAGRYAETIGEMLPMLLLGETAGAPLWGGLKGGWNALRSWQGIRPLGTGILRGAQSAPGTPIRELPSIALKHAVLPGAAVQTIEEAFPESKVGKTLQKVYPIARKTVPYVPAITRYLGKRIVPY